MTRFSLRDIFWLTLVVAMAVTWWIHSWRLHLENTRIKEFAREHLSAAAAYYDSEAAWVKADADAAAMRVEIAELKQKLAELGVSALPSSRIAEPTGRPEFPRRAGRENSNSDPFK